MASCHAYRSRLELARRLISPELSMVASARNALSTTLPPRHSAPALPQPSPALASSSNAGQKKYPRSCSTSQVVTRPHQQIRRYAGMRLPQAAATALAAVMPKTTGQIMQYGAARRMARACQEPAKYKVDPKALKDDTIQTTGNGEHVGVGGGVWHQSFPLLPTFSTWTSVSFLHLYLLYARIRAFDADSDIISMLNKAMVDNFFWDAEERMDVHHGMRSSMIRQRFLRDLFEIWRGTIAAYDEGLAKGDAVLAAAVWRNIFKAREDVDLSHLERVVAYMRCALSELDKMEDFDVQHGGERAFAHATITELLGTDGEGVEAKVVKTTKQEGKKGKN